jgi:hypothetical protein
MGKLFVVFEELPVMNKNEWNMCDSKLKDMATGTEMGFADKNVKRVQAENINNYIIITNVSFQFAYEMSPNTEITILLPQFTNEITGSPWAEQLPSPGH